MVKKLLTTLVALLTIVAAATEPARAQQQTNTVTISGFANDALNGAFNSATPTVQLTLGSNNTAMGRATMVLHPEYELYDTYTPSSSQSGTKTSLYGYGVPVVDNAWIYTSTSGMQSISIDPNSSEVHIHHLTIFNANNDSAEVESSGYNVRLYFKNGNVYREYECNELLLTGGVTRIEAYGMEMSLPAGVTATATAGVYDVVPGTQVPVAAVARTHHYLTGWSNSQTNDTITVTVNAATNLTANFAASPVLTLASNNAQMGSVDIPRHAGYGLLLGLKAADYAGLTSNNSSINGYYFFAPTVEANSTEWTNNENFSLEVRISAGQDSKNKLKVIFYGPNNQYYEYVNIEANNSDMYVVYLKNGNTYSDYNGDNLLWQGGVTEVEVFGQGKVLPAGVNQISANTYSVAAGMAVPVVATAKPRYHFDSWSNNSTEAQITYTMPATAATLTANFAANPTLTLTASPAHSGTVGFDFTPTPQTLTVNDGTETKGEVPIYLCFLDNSGTRGQHIIPAEQLGLMAGGTINSITWYFNSYNDTWSSTSNVNVYLKEVDATTLTEYVNSDTTLVYSGTLSCADSQMTVTFSRPYTYQGGNLLVGIDNPTGGNFLCRDFFGVSAPSGSSAGGNAGNFYAWDFLPKSTFNYTPVLPAGVLANNDGSYSVVPGTQLTLKANAADGYTLASWSNQAEVNTDATQTLTMPATDLTIGATFMGMPHTVTFAEGTEDLEHWTISPAEAAVAPGVLEGTVVTVSYTGTRKVKNVTAAVVPNAPQPITVTITSSDITYGTSVTKDGVTMSANMIYSQGDVQGPGSFSTTLGNFTSIVVTSNYASINGEGWSGEYSQKTWTGNASSVSFGGEIQGVGSIVCTIQPNN